MNPTNPTNPTNSTNSTNTADRYPDDLGLLCPWLIDSLTGFVRALENGATLPWRNRGTPYEKEIDPNGVTTEFVRCPDPTASGIVVKITRTALP
jgi:hypothetical protein